MSAGDPLPHSAAAQTDQQDAGGKWRPYEGPMGGEGWENIESGEIRYQQDPPGDTAVDADQQDDFNEENYTDDFLTAVQNQWGSFTLQFAEMATQPDFLLADPDNAFIRDMMCDEYGTREWVLWEQANHRPDDGLASLATAAIAFIYDHYDDDEAAEAALSDLRDELQARRLNASGIPTVPHHEAPEYAWDPRVPEYDEYFPQKHDRGDVLWEWDAVLYLEDGEWQTGRVDTFEGKYLYTLFDGSVIKHDQVKAWSPAPPTEAFDAGGTRVGEGDWVYYQKKSEGFGGGEEYRAGKVIEVTQNDDGMDSFTIMGDSGIDEIYIDDTGYYTRFADEDATYSIDNVDRHPPDGWDDIEQDGMEMGAAEIATDIFDAVDWENPEYRTETGISGTRYKGLTMDGRKEIRNQLKRFFRGAHVSEFYNAIGDWKADSITGDAPKHAHAFKQALDIESPARGYEDDVADQHVKIAAVMAHLSREFFTDEFGESAMLYRGIGDNSFETLIDAWLEDPDAESYALRQNALNNYTVSWNTAASFGHETATIPVEVEPDDIALLTDFIANLEGLEGEGEIHVIGDDMQTADGELYTFGTEGPDLNDAFDTWGRPEHERFAEYLQWKYKAVADSHDGGFSEQQTQTLLDWATTVRENQQDLMATDRDVNDLITEIEHDAIWRFQHGLHDDQTQLTDYKAASDHVIDLTTEADQNWLADAGEKPAAKRLSDTEWRDFLKANRQRRHQIMQTGNPTRSTGLPETPIGKTDSPWKPYEGPQGGEGWQHDQTGEIRYQEQRPRDGASQPSAGVADTSTQTPDFGRITPDDAPETAIPDGFTLIHAPTVDDYEVGDRLLLRNDDGDIYVADVTDTKPFGGVTVEFEFSGTTVDFTLNEDTIFRNVYGKLVPDDETPTEDWGDQFRDADGPSVAFENVDAGEHVVVRDASGDVIFGEVRRVDTGYSGTDLVVQPFGVENRYAAVRADADAYLGTVDEYHPEMPPASEIRVGSDSVRGPGAVDDDYVSANLFAGQTISLWDRFAGETIKGDVTKVENKHKAGARAVVETYEHDGKVSIGEYNTRYGVVAHQSWAKMEDWQKTTAITQAYKSGTVKKQIDAKTEEQAYRAVRNAVPTFTDMDIARQVINQFSVLENEVKRAAVRGTYDSFRMAVSKYRTFNDRSWNSTFTHELAHGFAKALGYDTTRTDTAGFDPDDVPWTHPSRLSHNYRSLTNDHFVLEFDLSEDSDFLPPERYMLRTDHGDAETAVGYEAWRDGVEAEVTAIAETDIADWTYDTSYMDAQAALDQMDPGDAVKIHSDGRDGEVYLQYTGNKGSDRNYHFRTADGDPMTLSPDPGGDLWQAGLEFIGMAKAPDDTRDHALPEGDPDAHPLARWAGFTPDPETGAEKAENLVSAVNRAWYKQAKYLERFPDSRARPVMIADGYSATNAHETLAKLHETMQTEKSYLTTHVEAIADHHPSLIAAYLDVFTPSEPVREALAEMPVIDALGIDMETLR